MIFFSQRSIFPEPREGRLPVPNKINPFRTAVPFGGPTTQIPSSFSPKRDWSSKRVEAFSVIFGREPSENVMFDSNSKLITAVEKTSAEKTITPLSL